MLCRRRIIIIRTGFGIWSSRCLLLLCPAHTVASEFDVVGIMHEAIEDGVPYCYSPGMARMRLGSRAVRQRAAMSGVLANARARRFLRRRHRAHDIAHIMAGVLDAPVAVYPFVPLFGRRAAKRRQSRRPLRSFGGKARSWGRVCTPDAPAAGRP